MIVITIVSVIAAHNPFPVDVKTRVAFLLAVSAELSTYVAPSNEESLNDPEPSVVHTPPVAPVTDPERTTPAVSAQTVWSGSALIYIPGFIVTIIVSVAAAQVPLFVEVITICTEPVEVSPALGI